MSELLCKRCGRTRPLGEFRPDPRYRTGYASWCKPCHRERSCQWAAENRKHCSQKGAQRRAANPDRYREINRSFKSRHKARLAEAHSEWAKRNPDKRAATTAKRKAAKLQATVAWANPEKIEAIYRKARAIQEATGVLMHVDHIVPLQGETVCGLHWEGNLQVVPAAINIAKRNRWDGIREAYAQPDMLIEAAKPAPKQETLL